MKIGLNFIYLFVVFIQNITTTYSQSKLFVNTDTCYFENIILNTDRELYIAGENIWFNINCFVNKSTNDSILSKIIYLELYTSQTKTMARVKFRLVNGKASGYLSIPENLVSGNYYLRAYTHYLRNYSPYLFPTKLITIVNPQKAIIKDIKPNDDVLIVPDGGKFIKGVATNLAIRINYHLVKNLYKAFIVDNNKRELIEVKPATNGLAKVNFMPDDTLPYFIQLNLKDGSVLFKPLPEVLENGTILLTEIEDTNLKISLFSNEFDRMDLLPEYYVEIKNQNYESKVMMKIKPDETKYLPKNQLSDGLIYLILKNQHKEIIHISSKFLFNKNCEEIKIQNLKKKYKPREKVEIALEFPKNNSTSYNYLIAVSKICKSSNENLLPNHISYNPVFLNNYLNNFPVISDSLKEQINTSLALYSAIYNSDNFRDELMQNTSLKFLPEIRDVGLNGIVVDKYTRKPMKNIMVYSAAISENNQFHLYKTKDDGEFYFTFNHLTNEQNVFISIKKEDSVDVEVLINDDFSGKYPHTELIPFGVDSSGKKLLEEAYLNYQLNKTFNHRVDKIQEKLKFLPLSVEDQEFTVLLKDFIKLSTMVDIFNEIVPCVAVKKANNHFYLNVYDKASGEFYNNPLVLIDGLPIFDIDELMKISPDNVEKIEVNTRKYFLGDYNIEGMIRISTRTKNFAGISLPKESVYLEFMAVTPGGIPVFPMYESISSKSRIPDFRNLLFWNVNPGIEKEKNNIQFYTSDHCGEYEIIIRGYNPNNPCFFFKTKIDVTKDLSN